MKTILYIVIAILIFAIIISVFIKRKLNRKLKSIDGFVGVTKNNFPRGKVVGGVIDSKDD